MRKLTKNCCQCVLCGDVIQSNSVHNWVACQCGEIFTDGGLEYIHRGARDFQNLIDLDEFEELP
jgi:hypothetical protein